MTEINGEIALQDNFRIITTKCWFDSTGQLSIKTDFTGFSTLNIELSLLQDTNHGTEYGYGDSTNDFIKSTIKYDAKQEIKTFDISSITGEKYINFIAGGYTDSTNTYITNIWLN